MKQPEDYWTYKGPPIPELADLPAGIVRADTTEDQWESLSPGMRRTIWREATKPKAPSPDDERLVRADAMHHQSEVQIKAREAL